MAGSGGNIVGGCSVPIRVPPAGGVNVNTPAIGALQTNNSENNPSNPDPGTAALTVTVPIDVPTLSEWSLKLLATLLAVGGLAASRKR